MKEWKRAAEEILSAAARPLKVFILGAGGVGKTTLAAFLANLTTGAGLKAALIDADVGQAEIGPPGSVGLGFTDRRVDRLRDVEACHACFVGSNTPELLSFTTIAAAKSAVEWAERTEPDIIIIDTCGLVWGRTARFLKSAKIELLGPTHIVALQRSLELEHFLRPWERLGDRRHRVLRVPVSPKAAGPGRRDRRSVRGKALRQYFQDSTPHEVCLDNLALFRTTYLSGRPMDESQAAPLARDLGCPVAHAEWLPDGLFIIAEGYFDLKGLERIKDREQVPEVFLTKTDRFADLLVGLVDHEGSLFGVGSLASPDFRRRTAVVWTPVAKEAMEQLAGLQFGILKVSRGGEELGKIHPNDI